MGLCEHFQYSVFNFLRPLCCAERAGMNGLLKFSSFEHVYLLPAYPPCTITNYSLAIRLIGEAYIFIFPSSRSPETDLL